MIVIVTVGVGDCVGSGLDVCEGLAPIESVEDGVLVGLTVASAVVALLDESELLEVIEAEAPFVIELVGVDNIEVIRLLSGLLDEENGRASVVV